MEAIHASLKLTWTNTLPTRTVTDAVQSQFFESNTNGGGAASLTQQDPMTMVPVRILLRAAWNSRTFDVALRPSHPRGLLATEPEDCRGGDHLLEL